MAAQRPTRPAASAALLPAADAHAAAAVPCEFRHPAAQREVELGGHRVAYALRRSQRRSIGFVVGADGLQVSAPRWVHTAEVDAALQAKWRWIVAKLHEQRERARQIERARVDWRDGATIPFLGAPVVVALDPGTRGAVLDATAAPLRLTLGLPAAAAPQQIGDAVQRWLQRQARRVFDERCALHAPALGVRVRRMTLSSAATRWGSASADGSIRLNWRLVHFALPVIDYVVVHELAHLREMNHGPAFWALVRSLLPDVEAARAALRSEVLPVLA